MSPTTPVEAEFLSEHPKLRMAHPSIRLQDLQQSIIYNEYKPIEDISKDASDLLKGLLEKEPKKRLTADEILNHPWFDEDNLEFENENINKYHFSKVSDGQNEYTLITINEDVSNYELGETPLFDELLASEYFDDFYRNHENDSNRT